MSNRQPKRRNPGSALALAASTFFIAATAQAVPLTLTYNDPVGDNVADLVQVVLNFDNSTGDFELNYIFDAANPFVGTANFNLNILNGSIVPATEDPAFVTINRFAAAGTAITSLLPTTLITVLGTELNLMAWNAGDQVGNNSAIFGLPVGSPIMSFLSGADGDVLTPAAATVTAVAVAEPASLTIFGLGLAGLVSARRRQKR